MCDGDVWEDMVIPFLELVEVTCKDVILEAETVDEGSVDCRSLQYSEALCCPSAASTCSICKDAQLFPDIEVEDLSGEVWTCGQLAYYAADIEVASADCITYQTFEEYCCPDAFIPIAPSTGPPTASLTTPPTYSVSR